MGGWKLEAFKMGIYMVFPVGCFWWFNHPKFFESYIMQHRKELFVPQNPEAREDIRKAIEMVEKKRQDELERELTQSQRKFQ